MAIASRKSNIDQRVDERRPYSGQIFIVAKDGFNEGRLKDYSRSGLFIIRGFGKFCIIGHGLFITIETGIFIVCG